MLILDLLKPSTWLSSVEEGLMGSITNGLRTLCFNIDTIIYELIINLYEFFETLCEARLLDNSVLNELSKRIGLILGLIMFFYVVFSFIQMLINPDKITDKETGAGAIVKKVIIVIVMLGTSNFIFSELYIIQKEIINQNIISRIILPYQISEETMNNFGNELSAQLMNAFYWVDNFENRTDITIDDNNNITACQTMTAAFYKQIRRNGKFDLGYSCLNESINIKLNEVDDNNDDQSYIIYFNGIISVIAGVFVVYLLFMYCLKIGVRMVQLAVLEIISPMAIVSYLSPKKDTMFNEWGKIYFATYIDVFIRIAIINFVVFLILVIFSGMDNTMGGAFMFWESIDNPTGTTKMFFTVIIVLALLTFAKKAPELIKELFPSGASKLGFGASIKDIVGLEKGAKIGSGILGGALGGAAIGLLGGGIGGFAGGLLKGGLSGFKGQGLGKTATSAWKNQQATNRRISEWRAAGGTNPFSRWGAAFNQWRGADTVADAYEREKADLEDENALYNQFAGYFDKGKSRAKEKIETGDFELETFAKDQKAYDAALEVFKQKQRIDLLKASAANADNTKKDENDLTELDKLNEQIASEMVLYNKNLDEAIYSYLDKNNNMETAKDKVIAQQYAGALQMKHSHPSLFGNMDITTANQFKISGDISKGKISENNNKLTANKAAGEKARADAKYSGRK